MGVILPHNHHPHYPPMGISIYLDNAASTPPHPDVIAAFSEIATSSYANPSSAHKAAYALQRELGRAAVGILERLGVAESAARVVWTSGGTEANNLAIYGTARRQRKKQFKGVALQTEHASVLMPLQELQKDGADIQLVRVDSTGGADLEHFATCLQDDTDLVCICHVQNETGTVQDLKVIREIMDRVATKSRLHIDAMQSFGKADIRWQDARPDMISASSHKTHGPGGVGALIVRRGIELQPLLAGGGQQDNLRSGSIDGVGIRLFAMAAALMLDARAATQERVHGLNRLLRKRLAALSLPGSREVRVVSPEIGSPYILAFSLPGFQGAVLARILSEAGIHIGTGSACASESKTPSKVLTAMGLSEAEAFGMLRVSFGHQNTVDDVEALVVALKLAVQEY
jgi:cysteine desulfurase